MKIKLKNSQINYQPFLFHFIKSTCAALLLIIAFNHACGSGADSSNNSAQTVAPKSTTRIIRVINNDVITQADIDARLRLFFLTSGKPYDEAQAKLIRPQVLQKFKTELLQIQAAEKIKLKVAPELIKKTLEKQARENNMSFEQMKSFFQDNNIPIETLTTRLKAQMLWAQYIRKKYGFLVNVSEAEIDQMVQKVKQDRSKNQYHIWEIFLRIESPEQKSKVFQEAQQLVQQLRQGASFREVARQFSQSPSAIAGGDLGKVTEGAMVPAIEQKVKTLKVGEISDPIYTVSGYYIVRLNNINHGGQLNERDQMIQFQQIIVPVESDETLTQVQEAEIKVEVLMRAQGCQELEEKAKNMELQSGLSPEIPTSQLPEALQNMLIGVPVGKCATPVRTPQGFLVTMPCKRKSITNQIPDRDDISDRLEQEKFSQYSTKELLKLDSTAYEEVKSF